MKKSIYSIEVLNWKIYNPNYKKNHPSVMISKRFFDDAKIQRLTSGARLVFIGLLLRRGELDHNSDTSLIDVTYEDMLRFVGGRGHVVQMYVDELESNQLVKIANIASNRKEENRKEENRTPKSYKINALDAADKLAKKHQQEMNRRSWSSYSDAYFKRYGVEPTRNGKVNSAVSQFVKRVGEVDSPSVLEFFVSHNLSFYVQNMHSITLALRDAESLHTQWKKGHAITQTDIRKYEKQQSTNDTLAKLDRHEI